MGVNTTAAQTAVTSHYGEEASAAPQSQRISFAGRQVSEQPESPRRLFPRGSHGQGGEAVARVAQRVGARVVRAIRSVFHGPVANSASPRNTPLPVPEGSTTVAGPDVAGGPAESGVWGNGAQAPVRPWLTSERVARARSLPWLTPQQNASRAEIDRSLGELLDRQDVPSDRMADLETAMELVRDLEGDVARADELLNRSRTEILSESDWRELSALVSSNSIWSSAVGNWLGELLGRIVREGALDSPAGRGLQELHPRVSDAERHLFSNDMRWHETVRRVETTLPHGRGVPIVVHSRVAAGTALGAHFVQGYPAQQDAGRRDATRYFHVPELALTTLVDASGETLFSGLRHAQFHSGELTGQGLQALADGDLRNLIDTFAVGPVVPASVGRTRTEHIDDLCEGIRRYDVVAAGYALIVAVESGRSMARETAAAALVADSEKFRRALDGETVDLNLHCVSLMSEDDSDAWAGQCFAFKSLAVRSPVALQVCRLDGAPRWVRANVQVRQTGAWVDGEHRRVVGLPRREVGLLLGSAASVEPGGAVASRREAMRSRASALTNEADTLGARFVQVAGELGSEHPRSLALLARRSDLWAERDRLERNARSLDEAARQLKQIWAERDDWPSGAAACERVLPRLVLLGHWMGETPVLSCRSDNSGTRLLDREVKFLATAVRSLNGHLPSLEPYTGAWERARGDFAPQ